MPHVHGEIVDPVLQSELAALQVTHAIASCCLLSQRPEAPHLSIATATA
jgi:hypothetical protein